MQSKTAHITRHRAIEPFGLYTDWIPTCAVILMTIACATGHSLAAEYQLLLARGRSEQASLLQGTFPGNFSIQSDSGNATYPFSELVQWGRPRNCMDGPIAVFRTGGHLVLRTVGTWHLDERHLSWAQDGKGPQNIPRESLAGVLWRPPVKADQLFRALARLRAAVPQDTCRLTTGDLVTGNLWTADHQGVEIGLEDAKRRFDAARLVSTVFAKSGRSPSASSTGILVGLRDGSLLPAKTLEFHGNQWRVRMADPPWHLDLPGNDTTRPSEITYLLPTDRDRIYVSDLRPASFRHIPYWRQSADVSWDQNIVRGPISIGGQGYAKGLGMLPASRLAIPVPEGFTHFSAWVGIDDAAGQGGSVVFRVYLRDPDRGWRTAATSPIMRGGKPAHRFDVELNHVSAVALLVDFADRGDVLDFANWGLARFERIPSRQVPRTFTPGQPEPEPR